MRTLLSSTFVLATLAIDAELLSITEAEDVINKHFNTKKAIEEKQRKDLQAFGIYVTEAERPRGNGTLGASQNFQDVHLLTGSYENVYFGFLKDDIVLIHEDGEWVFAREEAVDTCRNATDKQPWECTWDTLDVQETERVEMILTEIDGIQEVIVRRSSVFHGLYKPVLNSPRTYATDDERKQLLYANGAWELQTTNIPVRRNEDNLDQSLLRAAPGDEELPTEADWGNVPSIDVKSPSDQAFHGRYRKGRKGNNNIPLGYRYDNEEYRFGLHSLRRPMDDPRTWRLYRRIEMKRSLTPGESPWMGESMWGNGLVVKLDTSRKPTGGLIGGGAYTHRKRANRRSRFRDALTNALVPKAGVNTCIGMRIDLSPMGVAGLSVNIGLRGDLLYAMCRDCFEWKFEAQLTFAYGLRVFGRGIYLKLSLSTGTSIKEVICREAPESLYCQYIHVFLPNERGIETANRYTKCHSNSPFDVVMAYVKHRWQSFGFQWARRGIKALYADSDPDSLENRQRISDFDSDLTVRIRDLQDDMLAYKDAFRKQKQPKKNSGLLGGSQEKRWQDLPVMSKKYVFGESIYHLMILKMDDQNFQNPRLCWSVDGHCNKFPIKGTDFNQINLNDVVSFVQVGKILRAWIHGNRRYGEWRKHYFANHVDWTFRSEEDAKIARTDLQQVLDFWTNEVPKNLLKVRIVRGRIENLYRRHRLDFLGVPDPFVEVNVNGQLWSTSYITDTNEPEWQESNSFVLAATMGSEEAMDITFRVYDFDSHIHHRQFTGFSSCKVFPGTNRLHEEMKGDCKQGVTPAVTRFGSLSVDHPTVGGIYQLVNSTITGRAWDKGDVHISLATDDVASNFTRWVFTHTMTGKHLIESESFNLTSTGGPIPIEAVTWGPQHDTDLSIHHILLPTDVPGTRLSTVHMPVVDEYGSGVEDDFLEISFELMLPPSDRAASPGRDEDDDKNPGQDEKNKLDEGLLLTSNFSLPLEPSPSPLENIKYESPYKKYPAINNLLEAHHAAFEMFVGKVGKYAEQVSEQLVETDEEVDARWKIDESRSTGRYLARNYFVRDKKAMELKEGVDGGLVWPNMWKNLWKKIKRRVHEVKDAIISDNPCATVKEENDYRVLNIDNVLHRSLNRFPGGRKPLDFYAEVATSIANLHTRVSSDLQALFNLYFADDANFDGDCFTAWPKHDLPLEFADATANDYETQRKNDTRWARKKTKGSVREEGKPMSRDDNQLCSRAWASGDIEPARRTIFASVTPPVNEGDFGFPTQHSQLNSTIFSQFWCTLVSTEENVNIGFQSACRQLRVELTEFDEVTTKTWRRYDCEQGTIQPNFKKFLPALATKIEDTHRKLGRRLEDVLLCTARLTTIQREFPFMSKERGHDLPEACSLTLRAFVQKYINVGSRHYDNEANKVLTAYLRQETIVMLNDLREFMWFLETSMEDVRRDFKTKTLAWDLGPHQVFLGDIYSHLEKTIEEFTDTEKLLARMGKMQERVVQKAWDASSAYFLFPPPITFSETFKMDFGVTLHIPNMCGPMAEYGETAADIGYSKEWEGYTWEADYNTNSTECYSVNVRPIERLFTKLSRCTTNDDVVKWNIDITGIITLEKGNFTDKNHSFNDDLKAKLADQAMASIRSNGATPDLSRFKSTTDGTWQLIKEAIKGNLFEGDHAKLEKTAVRELFKKVKAKLEEKAKKFNTEVISETVKYTKKVVKKVDILKYDYSSLMAGIEITRKRKNAKWDKKFEVYYKRTKMTDLIVEIPSQAVVDSAFSWTLEWELSGLFNVLFDTEETKDAFCLPPYDLCVQCLSQVHKSKAGELIYPVACVGPAHQGYPIDCRNGTDSGSSSEPCLPGWDIIHDQIECATHQNLDTDAFGSSCSSDLAAVSPSPFSSEEDGSMKKEEAEFDISHSAPSMVTINDDKEIRGRNQEEMAGVKLTLVTDEEEEEDWRRTKFSHPAGGAFKDGKESMNGMQNDTVDVAPIEIVARRLHEVNYSKNENKWQWWEVSASTIIGIFAMQAVTITAITAFRAFKKT